MLRKLVLVVVLLAVCGCHRTTFTTTLPKGKTTVVWNNFYVFGRFGHAVVNTRKMCPNGVARIVTYQHAGHILLTTFTLGIYTPRNVYVTCAAEGRPR